MSQIPPILETYSGITVVRDDLHPGGTKARFIRDLYRQADELVYASPVQGGAQYSMAYCARELGKRATVFVAKRQNRHPRYRQIVSMGAKVIEVSPAYLTVVQARARTYAQQTGATLLAFGFNSPYAINAIADAARLIPFVPDEVWCASGSGVLACGLMTAWPRARLNAVQIGRDPVLPHGAKIWLYPRGFDTLGPQAPFPADRHYDAKAWEVCQRHHGSGRVLFWNVLSAVGHL